MSVVIPFLSTTVVPPRETDVDTNTPTRVSLIPVEVPGVPSVPSVLRRVTVMGDYPPGIVGPTSAHEMN